MRYECLEAGCTFRVDASSEEELVDIVQRHMSDAHSSFELEDVIVANAVTVDAPGSDAA